MASAHRLAVVADHAERVKSLAAALRTATFALPPGVDDIRLDVRGLARTPSPLAD